MPQGNCEHVFASVGPLAPPSEAEVGWCFCCGALRFRLNAPGSPERLFLPGGVPKTLQQIMAGVSSA